MGQAHGYMSYLDDAEGSECFEAKLNYDRGFAWPRQPAGFRAAVAALQDVLLRTSLVALSALVEALGLDRSSVLAVLDDGMRLPSPPDLPAVAASAQAAYAPPAAVDLATASHSAMRVWSYAHGKPSGWHCDNTLLTLSPAASAPGLLLRTLSGQTFFAEEVWLRSPRTACPARPHQWLSSPRLPFPHRQVMRPADLLLFAGDALSYLSGGRLLAAMHRAVPPSVRSGPARPPRVSAPFFLRPRRSALLSPLPRQTELPPLRVSELEHNAANLRSRWPWKRRAYFEGQEWHDMHYMR